MNGNTAAFLANLMSAHATDLIRQTHGLIVRLASESRHVMVAVFSSLPWQRNIEQTHSRNVASNVASISLCTVEIMADSSAMLPSGV